MTDGALFESTAHGHYRYTDTSTAAGAAVIMLGSRADGKRRVLPALAAAGERGLTDFDYLALIGMHQTTAGKRRLDLERDGLVRRACEVAGGFAVRPSATSGSPAAVWCCTACGYIEAESLPT
jgi:hypothetical protein